MQPIDTQQEYNRLAQLYREMHEDELQLVAAEAYDLTDIAREALGFEISSRGLKIPLNLTPASKDDAETPLPVDDGFVPDDQDLTSAYVANDMDMLRKVKGFLDQAGIECFLGDAKVHDPKALNESFDSGIEMRVWRAESQRAYALLASMMPDEGKDDASISDGGVRCPKCKSDGVIFDERDLDSTGGKLARSSKFKWVCDDCGHEWEDDGFLQS